MTTAEVRDELVRVRASRTCDTRAELAGLLRSSGTFVLSGHAYGLEAASEHPGVARRIYEAVSAALATRGEVRLLEPGRGHPRQRYVVRAADLSLQRLVEAGLLDESGAPSERIPHRIVAKRCCASAYLRGAFLARGSVSNPRRGAHFEIRASSQTAATELSSLLERVEVASHVRAHHGPVVYVKGNAAVGTALAAIGAHDAYLAWEEGAVWKSVHVEAARLANADAGNARRLVGAAVAQLAAISSLDETRGLRTLPAALREIAELRQAHPQASLDELSRLCDPPVTKAAVADRMRRLQKLARFEPARSAR